MLVAVLGAGAIWSATAVAIPISDYTWKGGGVNQNWSTAANWTSTGPTPPSGSVGNLIFPAVACTNDMSLMPCSLTDDITSLSVNGLSITDPGGTAMSPVPSWSMMPATTDTVTLGSGGLTTAISPAMGSSNGLSLSIPLVVGSAAQSWSIGDQTTLTGGVTGVNNLTVNLTAGVGGIEFGGGTVEVGNGTGTGVAFNGSGGEPVSIGFPGAGGHAGTNGDLNGVNRYAVTMSNVGFDGIGTVGPLSLTGSQITPGFGPRTGIITVNGALSLDSNSIAGFFLTPGAGASPVAGTDYDQIHATGGATLGNANLNLIAACGQPVNTTYTLIRTPGTPSGFLYHRGMPIADGGLVQPSALFSSCSGGQLPGMMRINYTATGVTATVVQGPVAQTAAASGVGTTTATLNGTLNPKGNAITDCHFEYGLDTSYGNSVPCDQAPATIGSGTSDVPVTATLTGLTASTQYHFRLVGTNSQGQSAGQDMTFTTLASGGGGGGGAGGGGTTTTTTTTTTNPPSPPIAPVQVGGPSVNPSTGQITISYAFPEPGAATLTGVVSQGATLATAARSKKCKKGFVRKGKRCVSNAPVTYGATARTITTTGTYKLAITPTGKVLAALKKGKRLTVQLTLTFVPTGTSKKFTLTSTATVHLKKKRKKK